MRAQEFVTEKWSDKYKRSINCSHPRGFSQRAHCAGRKKNEDINDEEIHNYKKLDQVLKNLCNLVILGQDKDPDKFGMVAAALLDTDNNIVAGLNLPADDGKRKHAERVVVEKYISKYGDIPEGSIIVTTLSPCSDQHMEERYGESCTDLLDQYGVKKVYAGYIDPTQHEDHRDFNIMETADESIRNMCKEFADTFLNLDENFDDGKNPGRKGLAKRVGVNCKQPVSKLRSIASHSSGEKQRMAHWCANMKSGRNK